MTAPAWIALAAFALALLVQFGAGLFHLGKHSQRIAALEERTKDIGSLAVLAATLAEMKQQLGELRHDVKNLLTGRVRPPSRRGSDE
jgi:cell division protein FtsB